MTRSTVKKPLEPLAELEREMRFIIFLSNRLVGVSFLDMGWRDNEGMKPAYFASMFQDNTSKNTVYLFELRNDECVSGVDVSIPLASVDE
ncbi:hypothetical protein Tco_0435337, partial [Tanacetum coccineum]